MRFCLLIFLTFLVQNVLGQVFVNRSSQLFSKESLVSANESLKAVDSPYRVIYIPVLHQLEPAKRLINDSTTLSMLLNLTAASGTSVMLDKTLKEQQTIDLATAKTYFSKLKDTAHTILILDNIVETLTGSGALAQIIHAQGRQFIYGTSVPASFKTIISGYSPVSQLDLNTPATAANDKYLKEYMSFISSTVNGSGAASVSNAEVYPQAFPILLFRQPAADTEYVYLDPAVGFTPEEQGELKPEILTGAGGFYKDLLFKEITPTIKKEDLGSYEVLMIYAYRMKKGDSLRLGRIDDAKREWALNGKKISDEITPPAQKKYSLDVFKDILADGDNNLEVTSDVGSSLFKNGIKSTFNVHLNYNSNNLFIKAVINGKTSINYQLVSPIVIAADDSGTLLKEKDKVVVAIYQDVDGVETKKEVQWGTYNGDLKAAPEYIRIIQNGNNEISFKTSNDGNLMTIRFATQVAAAANESYLFEKINVTALKSADDQQRASKMFDSALFVIRHGSSVINKKDAALADYFCDNNGLIQSYAFPGSDPTFKTHKNLNGVTNSNPSITVSHYKWLDIKVYQKKGVLEDKNVRLIAYLSAIDRQTLQNANIADTGYIKADKEALLNRIGKERPEIKKMLDSLITIKQLNDKALDTCYEFVQNDPAILLWYIDMSNTKKTIKLNYDVLSGSQELFTAITAHEMMHIYYPANNILSALKWMVIRDKEKAYGLKLGSGGCSEGPGHELYNPENVEVCNKQRDFTPTDNSKKF